VRPAQASLPHCFVVPIETDVVTLSSDTKEALKLLSLSPVYGTPSQLSEPSLTSGCDLFKYWPEANDMTMGVYIALTADASSSHASIVSAPCGDREYHVGDCLPSDLAHGRRRRDVPTGENLGVLVLHAGGLRERRLMLSMILQLPLPVMVCFPLLISTDLNGKLCTLALSKKVSLVLLTV
jgi:hypothetical protein